MRQPTLAHLLLLSAFVGGCAAPMEDSVEATESEIATGKVDSACGTSVPSPDGRYILARVCYGMTPSSITRLTVADGTQRRVASVRVGDTIGAMGVASNVLWFTTVHQDKSWELTVRDADLTGPAVVVKPAFPEGVTVEERALSQSNGGLVVTPDGRHVVMSSGRSGRFLIAARVDGSSPPAVFESALGGPPSYTPALTPSPDSSHVLVSAATTGFEMRFARLDLSGTAPALGPVVVPQLARASLRLDTYDGTSLFATGARLGVTGSVIASVDVVTGRATVLAEGFSIATTFGASGPHLWFTAQRPISGVPNALSTIERVTRGVASARVMLTSRTGGGSYDPELSAGAETVVYRTGRFGEAMQLSSLPSNGSAPPRIVYDGGGDLQRQDSAGGRTVYLERRGGEQNALVVDNAAGAIVERWSLGSGPTFQRGDTRLSGDGEVGYLTRSCQVGTLRGNEVVRLGSEPEVLLPCSLASSAPRLVSIPKSGAMLVVQPIPSEGGWRSQLVLLQP